METIFYRTINSKIGKLIMASSCKGLCYLGFYENSKKDLKEELEKALGKCRLVDENLTGSQSQINQKAQEELELYFDKKLTHFSVPLDLRGTPFQLKVWKELVKIPYGKTVSYKAIAESIGSPKACRAVGGANHNNPVAIIVPCHRVIGKNGALVGYGGGLPVKNYLLQFEGCYTK